ncbi:MAG: type I glyceraldehyde-3-phosphate dehydrogenase [Patescibacteria group bacterium]
MARIAINGFGRIGRSVLKAAWFEHPEFEVVAINDMADAPTLAYLLQHDSNYGTWNVPVKAVGEHALMIGDRKIPVYAEKDPALLPWAKHKVDVVIESTGLFTSEDKAVAHLQAGAKRVVLSAPGKGGEIPVYVRGVNDHELKADTHPIISNASCTTNCVAPVTAIIEEAFGIKKAIMTTVHGYTASQSLVDGPKKDLREGRAAAENIVPTTTGAAIAVTKTIPSLKGRFDGLSIRVPISTVSLSDMTFLLKQKVTVEQVNAALLKASKQARWKGLVGVSVEPLVSSDYRGDSRSAIVDSLLTNVVDGDLVKVVAWYDNEWGYSNRLAELVLMAAGQE